MKKFLTVLLALSVVFTYTVGTAFAATGVTVNAKADKTYTLDEVENAINTNAQTYINNLQTVKSAYLASYNVGDASKVNDGAGGTFSKEAVEKVIDKVIANIAKEIEKSAQQQIKKAQADSVASAYEKQMITSEADFNKAGTLYEKKADGSFTKANAFTPGEVTYYAKTQAKDSWYKYDGDYVAGLAVDDKGNQVVDTTHGMEELTINNAGDLTAAIAEGSVYEGSSFAKVTDTNAYDGTKTYYKKVAAATWYQKAAKDKFDAVKVKTQAEFDIEAGKALDKKLYKDAEGKEAATFAPAEVTYYTLSTVKDFTKNQLDEYLTALQSTYTGYDEATEIAKYINDNIGAYKDDLLKAEGDVSKAAAEKEIAKVDTAKYSPDIPANPTKASKYFLTAAKAKEFGLAGEGFYSFQDQAKGAVAKATKALAGIDITGATSVAGVQSKYTAVITALTTDLAAIPTIQDEKWDQKDLDAAKSMITAAMKSYLTQEMRKEFNTLKDAIKTLEAIASPTAAQKKELAEKNAALDALDSEYTALQTVYTSQINEYDLTKAKTFFYDAAGAGHAKGDIDQTKVIAAFPANTDSKALSAAKLLKVEELKDEADTMLKMVDVDGTAVYDKTAVEDGLKDAVKAAYDIKIKTTLAAAKTELAKLSVKDYVNPNYNVVKAEMNKVINGTKKNDVVVSTQIQIGNKFYTAIAAWATTGYDEDKTKEVKAVIEETKTAVRAATTVAAVDDAFLAGYAKFTAIPTKRDRTDAQKEKAFADKIKEYNTEIDLLVNAKEARYGTGFATDFPVSADNLKNALKTGLLEAYTVDELKTYYDKAAAIVADLKTTVQRTADAKTINDAITAVKTPVTAADKEAILNLNKQVREFNDYSKAIGDTSTYYLKESSLSSLTASIAAIDAKEISDAATALLKDGKITLDEKEAVNALVALVDTYEENYGADAVKSIKTGDVATAYNFDFAPLEKKAVEDAIAIIDGNAKPLDLKAIEAARKAYDALGENDISKEMYAKLIALEKVAKEYKISSVEALKIKASSTAGKGYIKVKWTVKGDAAAADGYQVYRSTKRNSGFGTKPYFTTKNKTYKNTKSLKKGTRYYYKVRAYKVVDGKNVYSDWSNKAYRIAK